MFELKSDELRAPTGQYRVVLVDMVPMIATGDSEATDYYHFGDFGTIELAISQCSVEKPGYATAYVVYDDKGKKVHENSGMRNVSILI